MHSNVLILHTRTNLKCGNKIRLNLILVMRSPLNSNGGVTTAQPKNQDCCSTSERGTAQDGPLDSKSRTYFFDQQS